MRIVLGCWRDNLHPCTMHLSREPGFDLARARVGEQPWPSPKRVLAMPPRLLSPLGLLLPSPCRARAAHQVHASVRRVPRRASKRTPTESPEDPKFFG